MRIRSISETTLRSKQPLDLSRGVTRLDGARDKKQLWRLRVRTWGLSEANVLYWRKHVWYCWDFHPPAVIRRLHSNLAPGNCAPLRYAPGSEWSRIRLERKDISFGLRSSDL